MLHEYSTVQFELRTLNKSISTLFEFVYFQYFILLLLSREFVDFSILWRAGGGWRHKYWAPLHFVSWCLTLIGPRCRTNFISHFWCLEFWHAFWIFWKKFCTSVLGWAELLRRYSNWLRAGWSGDQILVGVRFSATVQTGRGDHPAFRTMGTTSFPGVKYGRGVLLTAQPL
jgi:hypothetical protein